MRRYELATLIGEDGWQKYHAVRTEAHRKFVTVRRKLKMPKRCADCGNQACQWDHRDYFELDKVEAVCASCNSYRGPAWQTIKRIMNLSQSKTRKLQRLYELRAWEIAKQTKGVYYP